MSTMTIAGICIGCALLFLIVGLGLASVMAMVMVIRRSKSKGVKFSDGVSRDEWDIVREAASEVAKSEEIVAALQTVSDLVAKTLTQKQKV